MLSGCQTATPEPNITGPLDTVASIPADVPGTPPEEEPENETRPVMGNGDDTFYSWSDIPANGPGATFLLSDGEKAARLFLHQGQSVLLATDPQANLTLVRVSTDGRVEVTVNGERAVMESREDRRFADGELILHVDDVFAKS